MALEAWSDPGVSRRSLLLAHGVSLSWPGWFFLHVSVKTWLLGLRVTAGPNQPTFLARLWPSIHLPIHPSIQS